MEPETFLAEIRAEIAQLRELVERIEKSDRLQTQHITRLRRFQLGCFIALALGAILSTEIVRDAANRDTLERITVGAIAASITGLLGSEFVSPRSSSEFK